MRFILENIDRQDFNVEEYMESLRRAKALADNPQIILNLFGDKEETNKVEYSIKCYTDDYSNEFYITRYSLANHMEQYAHIEILTSKQAEQNEIEEIKGKCVIGVTEDDIPNYKLGVTVQSYTQIGNTDYWYIEK